MPATPAAQPAQPAQQAPAAPAATLPNVAVLPATTLQQAQGTAPVRSRVNRATGTRIVLWAPLPNGPQGGGTGTWVVLCQHHGQHTAHHTTRKAAKATVYLPQFWCTGCAAIVAAKQAQPAPQAPAAPAPQ